MKQPLAQIYGCIEFEGKLLDKKKSSRTHLKVTGNSSRYLRCSKRSISTNCSKPSWCSSRWVHFGDPKGVLYVGIIQRWEGVKIGAAGNLDAEATRGYYLVRMTGYRLRFPITL
jgi:hypothetical protein